MDRPDVRSLARLLLVVAIGIGAVGEIALDGPASGVNVPMTTGLVLAAAWTIRRRGRAPDRLDAWLPITALMLAGFVAVRADPFLASLDIAAAAAFTGASVAAFSGLAVTRRSLTVVLSIGLWVVESALAGTARLLLLARPPARPARTRPRTIDQLAPLARGLILATPLVLIFAVLFASADPIFRRGLEDAFGFRLDLGDLPGRAAFAIGIAWLAGGLLLVAARGIPAVEAASLGAAAPPVAIRFARWLGTTEALIVLIAIDLLFGLFVGLQLAYLFGGRDTLAAAGLTYSSYARRGYFELVAAAALSGGVLVGLEYQVRSRTRAYVGLAIANVVLTLVVLASAALRLQLYQDAYGWTELRVYVALSIVAMAATLLTLAIFLSTDRTRWLGHAMAVIGVTSLIALNLLGPAAIVAERNLARVIDPSLVPADGEAALDAPYLAVLPDDAVPAMVAALPRLPAADAARLEVVLRAREQRLAADPSLTGPLAWNLGRQRAREALGTFR